MSKIFMLTHKQLNRMGIMYVIKNGLQWRDAPS